MPDSGPQPSHIPIHQHILQKYNESAVVLGFQPTAKQDEAATTGGKLPLTIYESLYEDVAAEADDADKQMKMDDTPETNIRFRELPYSIETGEAEMISMNFVARGGGNATAVQGPSGGDLSAAGQSKGQELQGKGKGRPEDGAAGMNGSDVLSPEEDESTFIHQAFLFMPKLIETQKSSISPPVSTRSRCYILVSS